MKPTVLWMYVSSLLIVHPLVAQAPSGVLDGIQGVSLVVQVHLPPEASFQERDYEGQLQWVLESRLRMGGIPLLESSDEIILWVDINVMDSDDAFVFAYNIELQEPAVLSRRIREDERSEPCWVISWHFGGVGRSDPDKLGLALEEVVTEMAKGFILDWMAPNPRSKPGGGVPGRVGVLH